MVDAEGIFYLTRQKPMEVLAVMIPPSQYNQLEVQAAIKRELWKFEVFDAYEEVDDVGQEKIDSQWVIQKKEELEDEF